jgi:uncharacterized protein YprB with RNaseH-like and TPR domain
MLDEPLRRRLESLNRGPLGLTGAMPTERSDVGMLVLRKGVASTISPPNRKSAVQSRILKPIPGLLRRGEVVENDAGEHLRIHVPLDELWPGGTRLVAARQDHLHSLLAESRAAIEPTVVLSAESSALVAALPERVLLLDLETCGLAGAALFLVGLLRPVDGQPTVEMLFARNYAEERAVLHSLWQMLPAYNVLVTFNGKAFDWPMVLDRSTRYLMGGAVPADLVHVDLLHHARRRWRGKLPDCRLQTIEQLVCRRHRTGDVPGHRIPGVYAEYVRTGFEREIDTVLHHNAVDLVTLLDLALRLAA